MQPITIRMRRASLLVLLYVFLMPFCASYMQAGNVLEPPQATVSGTVTDTSGNPLAGVNLVVESKHIGTMSGLDGSFTINAGPDDVLIFSMIGFKTLIVPIAGREDILVSLEEDVTVLGEVVLNAGYYTVSEKERTGSIEKVTSVDIEKQPISNPLAALQGRVAGVDIQQNSGIAGANFSIQIRGRNSIRTDGNEPLYIVDGVPFSSGSLGEQQTSASILPGGAVSPLNNLNPTDIESIEILKDADATAIYGSRGANGVVLITTKKGKAGRTEVQFNILSGLGQVSNTLDLMGTSEYLAMRREAFANEGIDPIPDNAYDINGTWDMDRETDWQKVLFGKTAYLTNIQGSLSGGSDQTQFLVSGNYHRQTNVLLGDYHNDKVSAMANLNHRSDNDRLRFQLSANFSSTRNDLPASGLVLSATSLPPNAPELYDENGNMNWENRTWLNPLANLEGVYRSKASNLVGNARIGYRVLDNLELSANVGYTETHIKEINTWPSTRYAPPFDAITGYSSARHNVGQRTSWILEPQLSWSPKLGDTRFNALLGMTFQGQQDVRLSESASSFTTNSLIENRAAASFLSIIADIYEEYRYQAVYGRINVDHKGKYILNLTGRRDGSSRFGPDKRFSNFGAIGAAWVLSNEDFMANGLPWVSFGKLRASYGTSGNDQIGNYQYLDTYSFGNDQYANVVGLYPTRLFNPDFSWESNKKLEFALDLGLFNDRVMLNAAHYRNRSSNQLVGIPLPATTGFSSINANLDATVENTGWELGLHAVNLRSDAFQWSTSLNLTLPKNRLVAFPDLEGSTYANRFVIGEPLGITKVYQMEQVDPETGLYEFTDFNGDGNISSVEDKQVLRDLSPKYFGGLTNSLVYRKFSMDILFQFTKQLGYNLWGRGAMPGRMFNQPREVLQRWQTIGDQVEVQRFATSSSQEARTANTNHSQSDAAISDASFIRLKNLSLSYQLSSKQDNGVGCLLFLRGQNLLTITGYNGLDPAIRSNGTVPALRFITLGTQITF
ncbi:SusC/RagA family TonB-linked outer membrane protein [Flagellimonas halotolerans]|uniref:SusC/RagA family TonB-linked outer membrane protein n=1 Tax=Flagellimonas halotolerans TaxID=3112164 RepID=A0ABU6IRX2_9FLAO|nr:MULTISPECIES: SusC/RagA family TonB-linked outer membrane protein [unclassified Allomuricauda]MEC3965797.1 SusC/RagA family TonB-linked outer membrane protein [Muricauda sp. SYSU M86414]MEC4265737.1 SusC/RagA family TonB-linked outer membrane protein [Muricauda sp. SYSU M84420]